MVSTAVSYLQALIALHRCVQVVWDAAGFLQAETSGRLICET